MSVAVDRWVDAARDIAGKHAQRLEGRWSEKTKPHVQRILADSAVVAIRAVAGEDVTTATQALELSMTSLAREEKAILLLEGRAVALQAALFVLQAAIP